jgi:[ribosomal protein S5]-alanine N-acetyltransferase
LTPSSLRTPRLILRRPAPEDLAHFHRWLSDPEVTRYVGGVRTPERIRMTFDLVCKDWEELGHGKFVIVLKATGQVVGTCGVSRVLVGGALEDDLGYLIDRAHWRKGLAFEAAKATFEDAVENRGLSRITAWPNPKNVASVRVVEKLGFRFERLISEQHMGVQYAGMRLYAWTAPD